MTVAALVEDYFRHLALAGRAARTVGNYRQYLDDFVRFAASAGLAPEASAEHISRELVTDYQLALSRRHHPHERDARLSLATRNLYAVALRGLLRHGITRLELTLPAPDTVVLAKVGERTLRRMDLADFERLVDAIPPGSPHALRDRALLEVLFATGCRLSELCGLTRRRVNLTNREVEVLGKGRKVRGTFLTPSAADWLGRYLATRRDDSPYLFVSRQRVRHVLDPKSGTRVPKKGVYPLAPRTVQAVVEGLARRAGMPEDISPHWFRHGRLTIIARHAGLLAAQELAGHANPNTTRRYTRITSAELKRHFDTAERIERSAG